MGFPQIVVRAGSEFNAARHVNNVCDIELKPKSSRGKNSSAFVNKSILESCFETPLGSIENYKVILPNATKMFSVYSQ